jgi:integrase
MPSASVQLPAARFSVTGTTERLRSLSLRPTSLARRDTLLEAGSVPSLTPAAILAIHRTAAPLRGGGWDPRGDEVRWHFERFREARPIFVVALETGLSKSDLLGLRWSDVDQVNGWIRVVRQKTGRMSKVKFSAELRAALLACHRKDVTAEFVFITEDDRPEERRGRKGEQHPAWRQFPEVRLLRYFAIAKALAGITRRLRFHDLRHSFGSFHASAGTPLQVIRDMMGHADIKTTERYAKPDEAAIEQAVRELDEKRRRT